MGSLLKLDNFGNSLFSDGCSILTCHSSHDIEGRGIRGAALQIFEKEGGKDCPHSGQKSLNENSAKVTQNNSKYFVNVADKMAMLINLT